MCVWERDFLHIYSWGAGEWHNNMLLWKILYNTNMKIFRSFGKNVIGILHWIFIFKLNICGIIKCCGFIRESFAIILRGWNIYLDIYISIEWNWKFSSRRMWHKSPPTNTQWLSQVLSYSLNGIGLQFQDPVIST